MAFPTFRKWRPGEATVRGRAVVTREGSGIGAARTRAARTGTDYFPWHWLTQWLGET